MEDSIASFIQGMQTPTNKLNVKELREREEIWRALWGWIPDNVKYLTYRIGTTVRILKRDYKGSIGELGEIKWEALEYELAVYEKRYNEQDGKFWFETKIVKIPSTTVMMLEFISEQELAEDVEQEEIVPLEEEEIAT